MKQRATTSCHCVGVDRLGCRKVLLLSYVAEGIKLGSSKSTVIGTEVPVHYRWFLASMVAILYLCFALAFSVYRVPMV